MSDTVIFGEGISKHYVLGTIGSGSLRGDFSNWWQKRVVKNEAFTEPVASDGTNHSSKSFWALDNVSFEVKEGEALGIIGRNGAGKSTLLKILSRITKPTKGFVKGKGKVSSLLEIGTGFHPELTGKENIFISGHILGMTRNDILKKFDQIVEFSGVERFIDTPVKRYSSGMYVRLAFSVAAHLEPDILIVDEVLAVGDAEFQKKCLTKMNEAAGKTGRTILFVSHNLQAVNNLCSKVMWLENGKIKANGDAKLVVSKYLGGMQKKEWKQKFTSVKEAPGNEYIKILSVELIPDLADPSQPIDVRTPLTVKFKFYNSTDKINLSADLLLFTITGECIFDIQSKEMQCNEGIIEAECHVPGNFLNDGSYYFSLYFVRDTSTELFSYNECLFFEVADFRENVNWYDKWWGYVRPDFPLTLTETPEMINSKR